MLAIVPARGGSKGIPRKNVRNLAGKPLILHALTTLRQVPQIERIVVSTDDHEIAAIARMHGYEVLPRPLDLAADETTIAEVAAHAVKTLDWHGEVGVFQPTSPCVKPATIQAAISTFHEGGYESLASVVADTKLRWDDFRPLYKSRVNRQELAPEWCETGGIQLSRSVPAGVDALVGNPHYLYQINTDEAHDIDTPDDLEAARRALGRKRIEFRLVASKALGAGHLFRCLSLADELSHHQIRFGELTGWARLQVLDRGYLVGGWASPDLVVFDTLDTQVDEIAACKAKGAKVVTLEDLGPGGEIADLVVNELYADARSNVVCGPKWSVLRPEFLSLPRVPTRERAGKVLVLFGGTDPSRLSERVSLVCAREASVTVLVGPGATPGQFASGVDVVRAGSVAELVRQHDLVVTSAGRTVHEAAACGVPVVSIAANERESRHSHCPGILRLGLHVGVSNDQIQETTYRLLKAPELRAEMAATAHAAIDGLGSRRFAHRCEALLEGL